tara:strand:+ start:171 stop:1511 length:1341 start_codon:yes stop_codon:yes gene_type:complete
MAVKKSRKYEVDGASYAFDFVSDKLAGIKKVVNDVLTPVDSTTTEFDTISSSDESLNAFNVAKYGPNKAGYVDAIEKLSEEELQNYYNEEKKKLDNEQFVDNVSEQPIAFTSPRNTGSQYDARNVSKNKSLSSGVMAYPLDIDLAQDHFKITKYKYQRADINLSKSFRTRTNKDGQTVNVAGDSVIGSKLDGSVILPMPKATDANAAGWGGSDLTATELGTLGLAQQFDQDPTGLARLLGLPSLSGVSNDQIKEQFRAKLDKAKAGELDPLGSIAAGTQALNASSLAKLTGILGANIDVDTFLARTGGRVLNPNAEMLFQGPVIRDFSFEFQMIARSKREGDEIRKIIRFFKLGMAPKFQNIGFLANPDIFKLEYRNNRGILKTVNRFNPGGLALTTLKTDYAPNGYWAAYTDSQPVALKLSLAFTELRPIYEGDQEATPTDSVGY